METTLNSLREQYLRSREEVRRKFFTDHDCTQALSTLSAEADSLVTYFSERHLSRGEFCVLAIGGYGRRELFPFSDLDLLFVHGSKDQEHSEAAITATLHDLWDFNLHIGHQVWGLKDFKSLSLDHLEFLMALLDARVIAGNKQLGCKLLDELLPAFLKKNSEALAKYIIEATEERHGSYRGTIYQLEPDLKLSPGGLRDLVVAKWLVRLQPRQGFLPYGDQQIAQAYQLLCTLRMLLHFLTGRNQNRLTHRLQEELAKEMGHSEASPRSGVESLMKEYFLNARVVFSYCQKTMREREKGGYEKEIDLAEGMRLERADQILELFVRAGRENRSLSDRSRTAIVEALPMTSQTLNYATLQPLIRELFKARRGLYRVLSEMYELGVLELLFPEFGSIRARLVRDFYHKYTVDEHTLLAIKNIEDLAVSQERSDQRFRALLEECSDPELLTLSLLLHDVGKSREGKHVDRSARMAAAALWRFRFSKEEVDTIVFLIRHHLAMSSVMFRRDLEDEEVIQRFIDLVNDTSRLRLLCLLTFADIKAVAPETLNDWKKDLLWQLYVAAYHKLTFGYGAQRIEEEDIGAKLLAGLPTDLDHHRFEQFLEGFPRRYLVATPAEEIYQHFRLANRLDAAHPVQFSLSPKNTHFELCVVTPDRYFLFAKIAGVLAYFDMNILRGFGFSNRQNTVLDFFQFQDTRRVFLLNPEEKDRFRKLLTGVIKDEISVEKLLESKEKSVVFQTMPARFQPTVYFENEDPGDYTIMEIVAPDSIGLLYRIGREISGMRCNIELVLINTEGDKAVDVFYLTQEGKKLATEVQQELSRRIAASIS
ncbi:MAG: HD domain-containing protein [Acidobacteria bacterium]|nr:HD domain-containing protein [Acidobacteriota bacterium]